MKEPVIVRTYDAITYVLGNDATKEQRRAVGRKIYYAARWGKLTRYGGPRACKGRWNLREIDELLGDGFFSL